MATIRRVLIALVVTALLMGAAVIGVALWFTWNKEPLPLSDQCAADVADLTVSVTPEQAHYLSIIVGVATQRDLAPRASTIAIATVYQESGIRNLDYGDRDSLGLFQQRPSQGWGTDEQVQDPYHASERFYETLVTIPDWRNGDVNDVAQAVQRSGHPNGYAKHVENSRRLASALTGETPASFSCRVSTPPAADPAGLVAFLERTLPASATITQSPGAVTIEAASSKLAWSAASVAIANHHRYGLAGVDVGGRTWTPSTTEIARWSGEPTSGSTVVVRFEAGAPR
ncbi:MAG: hypothetical protein Q4F65_13930 [Propionibacteriaceae bacterium]|nr:hypothetical protein [Propionibacteriaceae bacterium]